MTEDAYKPMQVDKLAALDAFINATSAGLDAEVTEGMEGKDNLMKVCNIAQGENALVSIIAFCGLVRVLRGKVFLDL